MKLWDKGYQVHKLIEEFTVGNDYILDQKLVPFDCQASMAHARMLQKLGILTNTETEKLTQGLEEIRELHKKGEFPITREMEDCHTAIEYYLTQKLGSLGKKIHTARSRNDQVLTALRLYYLAELSQCKKEITRFSAAVKDFILKFKDIAFPGFTHTRKAMPSSVHLWGEAWLASMEDNLRLLSAVADMIDQSPLGTAAGYGLPMEIDREYTAGELGFSRVQENPIYAQASRGKFESSILHLLTQIMADLNKIAADLIFFSLPDLGYFELAEEICTGSSIMPHKKNPDALELVRAKYHLLCSYEFQVKGVSANLISGYHRDIQLSKEAVMSGFETTGKSLQVMALVFATLKVNEQNCLAGLSKEIYATEEVYKLVAAGMPFRDAYKKVAERFRK